MTKKTKLHKHAHNLIQGKEHHHGAITRGSVAASVAIASTLAIASVAQAEPLEKPAALEGAHTNSNSSTPAQGAQKGKHTQGANQGAAQGTVQNAAQDAAQGTSHNGENKPTSGDALNSTTPQSLTAHNTADSAPQSQNGAQTQQAGDKSGTPNPSDKTQAPADNKQLEQPQKLPNSDQVITPNNKNPDPTTKEDANQQVEREKDNKKPIRLPYRTLLRAIAKSNYYNLRSLPLPMTSLPKLAIPAVMACIFLLQQQGVIMRSAVSTSKKTANMYLIPKKMHPYKPTLR